MPTTLIKNTDALDRTVLVVLDVDGVLNRIPEKTVVPPAEGAWIVRRNGDGYWIDPPLDVIEALDELVRRPNVQLGWLTTWGDDVDLLVESAFKGFLGGGQVIASRPNDIFVPIDWKLRALLRHLEENRHPPYVWVDDDAVAEALLFRPTFADNTRPGGGARLLIDTDSDVGLTLDDVDSIRAFIDANG